MSFQPFGDGALRMRLPEGTDGPAVLEALRRLPGVVDAVVSEQHAMVRFDPSQPPEHLDAALERALSRRAPVRAGQRHTVCVEYDGEDLEDVARSCGLSVEEVVAAHAGSDYAVAAIGFLPGFAYLRGLDPRLTLPRRTTPRARVAPLSVGLAGPYSGVYPFASPGGWNLVGKAVGFVPFDAQTGAALALGDFVRFTPASRVLPSRGRP